MMASDLVSVVIPAYNAAATIDATLYSVRAQTHANLEILVVDDGSSDRTPEIVMAHALDERVRLIRQLNGGVAEARNYGIRKARGEFLAFVDADDLWAPDKIEKQLAALRAGGPRTGLVYTWYAVIDGQDRIIESNYRPTESGDVLERLCRGNLVGNGSSPLVTRAALTEVGAFDPTLRARGAEGCEDWQFYFRVAERYHFAVVPEALTGYRQVPGAMSSNVMQMVRSADLVADGMRQRQPTLRAAIASGRDHFIAVLLARAFECYRPADAAWLALALLRRNPVRGARLLMREVAMWVSRPTIPRPTRERAVFLMAGQPKPKSEQWT